MISLIANGSIFCSFQDERFFRKSVKLIIRLSAVPSYPTAITFLIPLWKIHSKDWASFPNHQKWFAVGECMAHLDYLRLQGRIVRKQDEKGIWHYFQS